MTTAAAIDSAAVIVAGTTRAMSPIRPYTTVPVARAREERQPDRPVPDPAVARAAPGEREGDLLAEAEQRPGHEGGAGAKPLDLHQHGVLRPHGQRHEQRGEPEIRRRQPDREGAEHGQRLEGEDHRRRPARAP